MGKENYKLNKRISNRRYPLRKCKKPECKEDFVPSDSRQIYCCEQHRIDFNNDKRKLKEAINIFFLKSANSNRAILKKIKTSAFYKKHGYAYKFLLDYEGYDFTIYHCIIINKKTGREVQVCFDYTLELIDAVEEFFSINNTLDYDL
ncbi:hypothetical protein [Flavobacterium lacus]|uniref:Uncharacterized protein n=1 Tax=Flavobacterium lacus TaxID=1353778 RepID=A0A328WUN3_9FLAO|nr:hypothetical protein [Flavobacterium lacus]RAR48876.1 hypothetical protein B0I10_10411 [Flavobacterium lacus]